MRLHIQRSGQTDIQINSLEWNGTNSVLKDRHRIFRIQSHSLKWKSKQQPIRFNIHVYTKQPTYQIQYSCIHQPTNQPTNQPIRFNIYDCIGQPGLAYLIKPGSKFLANFLSEKTLKGLKDAQLKQHHFGTKTLVLRGA